MLAKSIDYIFYLKDFKVSDVLKVDGYNGASDIFEYTAVYRRVKEDV